MNTQFIAALKDLIKNLNATVDFYRQAQIDIGEYTLWNQLQSLITLHESFAATLQPYMVISHGERESGRDFSVEWRKYFSHLMVKLKQRPELTYYPQFTAVEKETLSSIKKAAQLSDQKAVKDQLQTMHDNLVAHYYAILSHLDLPPETHLVI